MKESFAENNFVIDLSSTQDTSQLVLELSSIMEQPEVQNKNICLKLGKLDLNQSQLLSIKALIESADAVMTSIETNSEQTTATAESLGLNFTFDTQVVEETLVKSEVENIEEKNLDTELTNELSDDVKINEENDKAVEVQTTNSDDINGIIQTTEGIVDIYTEESTREISEIIPSERFKTNFESLALNEGLVTSEDVSKYILLDTGDVLPDDVEENSIDTKTLPTLYLNQNLRSGQTVTYEGNILILGDAHPGSEIIADGDITVWGILGGIAHAGAHGNITAKVRALKLNAIQLRIAGLYARRNDTLNVPYVQKSNEFTPEEAQIEEKRIVIYKKLRRD